ncbi:hypothetical protein BN946_scf184663.g6 [Trametes cinnabarina]|uniref:Uncharacterized protein n=1 Tax=Pycnoporus cinnabarinus TaxID=5643 RepID=A0A060SIT5_PYCCI|nr:hypothetical protein BN946_scf184663.g6 [Trametes cinnabarina]
MSIAAHPQREEIVCGINSAQAALEGGQNENCRVFEVKDNKISPSKTRSTLKLSDADDDYQLSVLSYPTLDPIAAPVHLDKGEIFDASFSSKTVVVASTVNLLVYSLPAEEDGVAAPKEPNSEPPVLELLHTIDRPELPGKDAGSSFRAGRHHPHDEKVLYTVMNTVPPRTRTKSSPKRSFICKWDTETWKMTKTRQVSDRQVTCFDISPDGKLLAYGSSDLTVGVVDAQTLAPLLNILKAHDFPPTTLRFNPTSDKLISGSADNTVRIVTIPQSFNASSWSTWILVIVALLVALFAFLAQQMHQGAY